MIALLRGLGADVVYHDPHVREIPGHDIVNSSFTDSLDEVDCAVIVTAHKDVDHNEAAQRASP